MLYYEKIISALPDKNSNNSLYKYVSEIKIHQSEENLHSLYLFHVLFSQSVTNSARNVTRVRTFIIFVGQSAN
jgi:hypothetical protein